MATISETIDKKFGSLPKFAEEVWQNLGSDVAHGKGDEVLWGEIARVCVQLLGDEEGDRAARLLKDQGFFSIVFPD
jgi:hypothetical protein